MTTPHRAHNFNAGPAALPFEVLQAAHEEFLDFKNSGMSIMEMSHRSKEVIAVIEETEKRLRNLLNIGADYSVLFLQGGASLQFVMAPMNLQLPGKKISMIQSGYWTNKALGEIKRLGLDVEVSASSESDGYVHLPSLNNLNLDNSSYVHLCTNNTIFGTQWKTLPPVQTKAPIVADMSSDFLSRPFDINQFGMVFAGAQKNLGPSGLTLAIIRKDLAERAGDHVPKYLTYQAHIEGESAYNTPPVYSIYIAGKVLEWIERNGGLEGMKTRNEKKAAVLYDLIEKNDFYSCPIAEADRSLMNVVFRISRDAEKFEPQFVSEATKANMIGLKGHRSIGGLRASIYNAQTPEAVSTLAQFMEDFAQKNK